MRYAAAAFAALFCAIPAAAGAATISDTFGPIVLSGDPAPAGGPNLTSVTVDVTFDLILDIDATGVNEGGSGGGYLPPIGTLDIDLDGILSTDFGDVAAHFSGLRLITDESGTTVTAHGAQSFTFDPSELDFEHGFPVLSNYSGSYSVSDLLDEVFVGSFVVNSRTANSTYAFHYTYADSGVPEPTTWAMMMAGFGLAGGALRASRKRTAAPA